MSENIEDFSTFSIGSDEPKENIGPWLKDGKEWYVFNEEKQKYVSIYERGES